MTGDGPTSSLPSAQPVDQVLRKPSDLSVSPANLVGETLSRPSAEELGINPGDMDAARAAAAPMREVMQQQEVKEVKDREGFIAAMQPYLAAEKATEEEVKKISQYFLKQPDREFEYNKNKFNEEAASDDGPDNISFFFSTLIEGMRESEKTAAERKAANEAKSSEAKPEEKKPDGPELDHPFIQVLEKKIGHGRDTLLRTLSTMDKIEKQLTDAGGMAGSSPGSAFVKLIFGLAMDLGMEAFRALFGGEVKYTITNEKTGKPEEKKTDASGLIRLAVDWLWQSRKSPEKPKPAKTQEQTSAMLKGTWREKIAQQQPVQRNPEATQQTSVRTIA